MFGTKAFPRLLQFDDWSCGSRSIQATLKFFGVHRPHWLLKTQLKTSSDAGTAVHRMIRVLRRQGLRVGYRPNLGWRELVQALKVGAVAIVHLDGDHSVRGNHRARAARRGPEARVPHCSPV